RAPLAPAAQRLQRALPASRRVPRGGVDLRRRPQPRAGRGRQTCGRGRLHDRAIPRDRAHRLVLVGARQDGRGAVVARRDDGSRRGDQETIMRTEMWFLYAYFGAGVIVALICAVGLARDHEWRWIPFGAFVGGSCWPLTLAAWS